MKEIKLKVEDEMFDRLNVLAKFFGYDDVGEFIKFLLEYVCDDIYINEDNIELWAEALVKEFRYLCFKISDIGSDFRLILTKANWIIEFLGTIVEKYNLPPELDEQIAEVFDYYEKLVRRAMMKKIEEELSKVKPSQATQR